MEANKESIDFIAQELIPEMVFDRCFCENSSREFVELESVCVEHLPVEMSRTSEIYRAKVVVRFSGEPRTFPLVVKLLPGAATGSQTAFDAFQNEEMFYSKMTLKYGTDFIPKCYLSDLGRYGRPVIVLEDLEAAGYEQADGDLDQDHLKLCVRVLGKLHGRGLRLRATEFSVFREYQAKLMEITLTEESMGRYEKRSSRITDVLDSRTDSRLIEKVRSKLSKTPLEMLRDVVSEVNDTSTMCHGHFSHDNILFKYENGRPIDVKVIDWQTMRYCSPAVDLGPILLYNTTHENGPSEVQDILTVYVDAVKSEYPEISAERLRQDIIDKFLFVCLILSFQEHVTDDELAQILMQADELNAFD